MSYPGLEIVYSDGAMAIIDKPAGLIVHAAPGHHGTTMVDELGELLAGGDDPERPGVVHRLDRDTSGLLMVARSSEAHGKLSAQIADRAVSRVYLALVEGRPGSRRGKIDAPLGRDHRNPERVVVGGRRPRSAVTRFEAVEALPRDTLLEVQLETGRTHQIRAHLQAIECPVAGDPRYGGAGRHQLDRQFLHSHRLELSHPLTGEQLSFRSELPEDLSAALKRAREGG